MWRSPGARGANLFRYTTNKAFAYAITACKHLTFRAEEKDDPEEEGPSTPPYTFQISLAIRNGKNMDLKKHKLCLTLSNLKNSSSVMFYLCIIPCFCFVQRMMNGTSLVLFTKCGCIIIWIPKYFCLWTAILSVLGSRDDVSSSIWPIKVPGTDSQHWHYLLASARKSSRSKTCAGGMAYRPDPALPCWARESKGSQNTQSLRKAKWSPRRSRGQRCSRDKLCI